MYSILLYLKLCLFLLLVSFYSKANTCLPDVEGLCTPETIIEEQITVEKTEEDKGTEIIYTTKTTKTTTTTTITNEDSGDILDGDNGYVPTSKEGDMDSDWGGQGPASMPSGTYCGQLGTDKCAEITGSGDSTSNMGVTGMGTTFVQTVDISDLSIDNGGQVKYSIEVNKQDDQDRIYMHVTGTNGGATVFSGTDILSESGVSSGYQSYNGTFDFSGVLKSLTIEIGGRDINLAVGPLFDDVSVNVFYNVINTIIEQQITSVEEIVYLNIFDPVEIEYATEIIEFNDVVVDDAGDVNFKPIEPQQEEVSYETVEIEIQEIQTDFEIDIPEPEIQMAEMEMEIELEIEAELEETIEVASVEEPVEEPTEKPVEETTEEEPMEEVPVESESTPEPVEEKPEEVEEPEEKPANEPSAKEKAATKIVKDIDDKERYDDTAQTKTLLVMQILGDTKTFFTPTQSFTEVDVGEYLNKTLEDQYGILFDMAQNNTMNDMVNSQWQKSQ
jgi:hypothetical protein